MFGSQELPETPQAQAGGEAVPQDVQPGAPQESNAPTQPEPRYLTEDQWQAREAELLRRVQSTTDKKLAALKRELGGTAADKFASLASKHQIPAEAQAAFFEEAQKAGLIQPDAEDTGEPEGQPQDQGQGLSHWEKLAQSVGLETGDPEVANLYPHNFRGPSEFAEAIVAAGKAKRQRMAGGAAARSQQPATAPASAPALYPSGSPGGGNKPKEKPSRQDASRDFYKGLK